VTNKRILLYSQSPNVKQLQSYAHIIGDVHYVTYRTQEKSQNQPLRDVKMLMSFFLSVIILSYTFVNV